MMYSKHGHESIKCEEVDIKEEVDIEVEECVSDQSRDNDNVALSGFSEISRNAIETELKVDKPTTYYCPKCPYSSDASDFMMIHVSSHSSHPDKEEYKCSICPFVADAGLLLDEHLTRHRGRTKPYGCHECPFETEHKASIKKHLLRHRDNSELEMQKCPLCPFESKYKSSVRNHWKLQHNTDMKMLQCEQCSFSTKRMKSLRQHQLVHKEQKEINTGKCEKCPYETKRKDSLLKHMRDVHGSCNVGNILRHRLMRDINVAETVVYYCAMCKYQTKYERALEKHRKSCVKKVQETDDKETQQA